MQQHRMDNKCSIDNTQQNGGKACKHCYGDLSLFIYEGAHYCKIRYGKECSPIYLS